MKSQSDSERFARYQSVVNVLQQAKRYARGFQDGAYSFGEYHLPFAYSTNGKLIWFQDLRDSLNLSREVAAFHTPLALAEKLSRDEPDVMRWFMENEVNTKDLWPFQIEAIKAIEESIRNRRRKMMVAMATGTGKTRTMVSLMYRLLKSGYAKRILFLVNRPLQRISKNITQPGRELGPQDYLREFEKFVRENPQQIEALEILLKRSKDFDTNHLKSLRQTLATQPDDLVDKFTEKNLRRAYSRELADIISLIRYAASGGELLTVEQRVDKALMKVKSNRSFTEEQQKWLTLVRGHLIENLLMEKEDVDTLPIFTREGASWGKLNKIFKGELGIIIQEINSAIAA